MRGLLRASIALFLFVYGWSTKAGIGQVAATAQEDCQKLSGTFSTVSNTDFKCVTRGATIHFFTTADGKTVQRISWVGRQTPPFDILMAEHAEEYKRAFVARNSGRRISRALVHETSGLVVRRKGNGRIHYGEIVLKN